MKAILKKIIRILIKKNILFKKRRILGIFIFFLLTCFHWNIVETQIRLKLKDEDIIGRKYINPSYSKKDYHTCMHSIYF